MKNTTRVYAPGFLSNCGLTLMAGAGAAVKEGVAMPDIPEGKGVSPMIDAKYYRETALDQVLFFLR
ncbi:hypothetical protein D9M73_231490 [compost metagenome]